MNNNSTQQTSTAKRSVFRKIIIVIISVVFALGFIYIYVNFPALWQKNTYSPENNKPAFAITPSPDKISKNLYRLIFLDTVGNYPGTGLVSTTTQTSEPPKPSAEPSQEPTPESNDQNYQISPSRDYNNYLFIPNLNIKAPILWDTSLDEATMLDNLRSGVIHYLGTAKPGEKSPDGNGEGNIFIAGHSSYFRSDPGKYKTVFVNLDKLNEGDQLAIVYNSQIYVYNVVEKKVVMPEDVSVLSQNTDKPTLSLMTCVPVGTNDKRLIIRAEFAGMGE